MVFSPDGKSFVEGTSNGEVVRTDVELLVSLGPRDLGNSAITRRGHKGGVHSVAFSRDGATLASGASDGTMLLWDWPRPDSLRSQWPFNYRVANNEVGRTSTGRFYDDLEVQVLDQHGDPLEGVAVTFAVTAGGGTLSATREYREALSATTDFTGFEGFAYGLLTMGEDPGTTTVTATVAGLDPVIFIREVVAVPTTLTRISGNHQQGPAEAALAEPFVVEVRDHQGNPLEGATVTFSVTAGEGTLSATTVATDEMGRASVILTLGSQPETVTVSATATGQVSFTRPLGSQPETLTVSATAAALEPVTFTATAAAAAADFDGDGEIGFSDFFLFADAFDGTDPRFDLDGSGRVDFADFFLLADHFLDPETRGKLLVLARERIGLPDGPQLQQNAPNPFNSQTVITWFQLRDGPARVEVFALTGQRVAVLHQGGEKAGFHRVHWDGRDEQGRALASGVYFYRLTTNRSVHTRKLTLLR